MRRDEMDERWGHTKPMHMCERPNEMKRMTTSIQTPDHPVRWRDWVLLTLLVGIAEALPAADALTT